MSLELRRRQLRRLGHVLEESPWEIVLMKFTCSLLLPHAFCCPVDYLPDGSAADVILFCFHREARTRRPSVLVFPSGFHHTWWLAEPQREPWHLIFSLPQKKEKDSWNSGVLHALPACPQPTTLAAPHGESTQLATALLPWWCWITTDSNEEGSLES